MAIDDDRTTRPIPNEPPDTPPPTTNGSRRAVEPITPHDPAIEAGLLGIALLNPAVGATEVAALSPERHFYLPAHVLVAGAIQDLHERGEPVDAHLVSHHLATQHLLEKAGGAARIVELLSNAPISTVAPSYAQRLRDLGVARAVHAKADAAARAARNGDTAEALAYLAELDAADIATGPGVASETLADFLATDEEDHDWLVAGLLERADRVLVTGPEGGGKSTLLRQIAVQVAAGIHPFDLEPIEPLIVLLLDLENSRKQIRRQIRPLHIQARRAGGDRLHIAVIPEGLDLTDATDLARLNQLVDHVRPDLVVGGPVYKLVGGDPTEEQPAKAAAMAIDRIRARHGTAWILETHQPHEVGSKRPERPYGASLWKRWPEFGLHLAEGGQLRHWRGARDAREWPVLLQRGGEWPWTGVSDTRAVTYASMVDAVKDLGRVPSNRELAVIVSCSEATVRRAIKTNEAHWKRVQEEVEG